MGSSRSNRGESRNALLSHFSFDPLYHNLNHASYGATPKPVQLRLRSLQDEVESCPDRFIRKSYPRLLNANRAAVADLLRVPLDTIVFVPNATTALNVILTNLEWHDDGKDEILFFSTIYGACGKTVDYVVDSRRGFVSSRSIPLVYPVEDADIVARFETAVHASRDEGRRPRLCVFDVVSSLPGVKFPFEAMTHKCKDLGVMSVIDGAQAIGMVDSKLDMIDPDFWFSNCHKWLYVPRACAVLYCPERNQHLLSATVPVSHGYVKKWLPTPRNHFVSNFQYTGTLDFSPYLCVIEALAWRREVVGGEERVQERCVALAKKGGQRVAEMLGTEVLDNKTGTMTNCAMTNVRLPIRVVATTNQRKEESCISGDASQAGRGEIPVIQGDKVDSVAQWMMDVLLEQYRTFIVVYGHGNHVYVRLSAQVYLDLGDFEWAGRTLGELCRRVAEREYLRNTLD
ncbi:hypothetical protein VTK73DRAFT_9909 [Phialemonium thermophilum]|uniref:Aminotransferase class V domain-containing protein n=1 Tax=Phialemonium thermophilum TaxID=223376 RepID=A0ABR3XIY1_9PEZI